MAIELARPLVQPRPWGVVVWQPDRSGFQIQSSARSSMPHVRRS